MAHTRRTLALDSSWDLTLNESGGVAIKEGAEATAQNVANECRLFSRDGYFCQDRGIPYFLLTLGQKLSGTSALRGQLRKAAQRVEDVKKVESVEVSDFDTATRRLSGDIQVSTYGDETVTVSF